MCVGAKKERRANAGAFWGGGERARRLVQGRHSRARASTLKGKDPNVQAPLQPVAKGPCGARTRSRPDGARTTRNLDAPSPRLHASARSVPPSPHLPPRSYRPTHRSAGVGVEHADPCEPVDRQPGDPVPAAHVLAHDAPVQLQLRQRPGRLLLQLLADRGSRARDDRRDNRAPHHDRGRTKWTRNHAPRRNDAAHPRAHTRTALPYAHRHARRPLPPRTAPQDRRRAPRDPSRAPRARRASNSAPKKILGQKHAEAASTRLDTSVSGGGRDGRTTRGRANGPRGRRSRGKANARHLHPRSRERRQAPPRKKISQTKPPRVRRDPRRCDALPPSRKTPPLRARARAATVEPRAGRRLRICPCPGTAPNLHATPRRYTRMVVT